MEPLSRRDELLDDSTFLALPRFQPSSEPSCTAIATAVMPILHNARMAVIERAKLTRY